MSLKFEEDERHLSSQHIGKRAVENRRRRNRSLIYALVSPYPYFAQIYQLQTNQISSYNGLQVTAERRAHGLTFLASYSYSHALDENTGSPGNLG